MSVTHRFTESRPAKWVAVFRKASSVRFSSLPPGTAMRFNPPPNWPPPPPGWIAPPGWRPDPAWGPAPTAWQLWIPDPAPTAAPPDVAPSARPTVSAPPPQFRAVYQQDR